MGKSFPFSSLLLSLFGLLEGTQPFPLTLGALKWAEVVVEGIGGGKKNTFGCKREKWKRKEEPP